MITEKKWHAISVILISIGLYSCSGEQYTESDPSSGLRLKLKAQTIIPDAFTEQLSKDGVELVVVPANTLLVSLVVRPRAEIRVGPGSQFELLDKSAEAGEELVHLDRRGVWRKVVHLATGASGWVHSQALSEPKLSKNEIMLPIQRLPTVQLIRATDRVWNFPGAMPLRVKVPQGAMFRQLRRTRENVLVAIPSTNSVMWLSRKDLQ